jgi:BASS family bile acid:Na+ symporter
MQGDIISSVVLPLVLAFIMFALGLGLTPADFRRVLHHPRAVIVGAACHFILLPLVCFGMLRLFGMGGVFAVGFMVLAACPTGSTSNLLTFLARGDVALALSFTAVASIVTIFSLPLIVTWSLAHFMDGQHGIHVSVLAMTGKVFLLMGLPVALGMVARHYWPARSRRVEGLATKLATVLFVGIVVLAAIRNWALLRDNFSTLAPFAMALNVTMLACGFVAARLARLSRQQAVTLGIETAVQNASLALAIATNVLRDEGMAVPGALYGVLMYIGGTAFALAMRPSQREGAAPVPVIATR